jgi:ABC-type transport system involved in multi-copper enzyme maturation permease subunit
MDVWGIMTVADPDATFPFLLPLLLPFIVGDSLVRERHNSYSWLILTRGLSKFRYIACKMLGGVINCLVLTIALTASFSLFGSLIRGATLWIGSGATQFHPNLLIANPLLHAAAVVALVILSCIAVLGLTFVASTYTSSPYVAMSAPLLVILALAFFLPSSWQWLSPYERITFMITHQEWVNMINMTTYWLAMGGILYSWAIVKYIFAEGV